MDSFNMLAPHTCSARNAAGKTLLEQYYQERTDVAIKIQRDLASSMLLVSLVNSLLFIKT